MKFKRFLSLLLVLALNLGCLRAPAAAAEKPEAVTVSLSNILSSGCIRLTWDAVENGKYYRIYRSATESGGYTKIKTTSSLSYTDKDAQPGETWYYLIKTVSPEGSVSSSSGKVCGTAKLPRPTVTLSGVSSSGKIKVSWEKLEGASSYRVYRSPDKESWTLLKKTTSGIYTDTSAQAGSKYYYRVMAVLGSNTAGNSAYSSPKSRTCDLPRPVAAVTNDPATGRITVSWNRISGASSYRLYCSTDQESWELLKKTTSASYTDTSALEGQTYYYKVLAVLGSNTAGNSAYSPVVSGIYTVPNGLTLKLGTNAEGQAYLTWNAVKGAESYRVYRSYRETAGFKLLSTRTPLYYTNASAPRGVDLFYYIKALDGDGNVLETSATQKLYLEPENEQLLKRYVSVPSVKVYSTPETASESLTLDYMDALELGSLVTGSWYRVFREGQLYYIYGTDKLTDVRSDFVYTGNTPLQQEVLDLAMDIHRNWNTIYATGQSTGKPNADGTYGFNAPGLVKYILNSVMEEKVPVYQLSLALDTLYSTEKLYNEGYPGETNVADVAMEEIQPGDVLFFGTSATPGYCGLYLGNGEFIYATASAEDGIGILPLSSYLTELMAIRRYLPEEVTPANTVKSVVGDYKTYKLYEKKDSASAVILTLAQYDTVTVLFTDSGNWAYVEAEDGTRGFMMAKYLGDYEYLDHVILSASLNADGKPSFTWNSVKNAAAYELYRSLRSDRGFELVGTTENTYYSNLAAPGGLTFYYRLRALAADGTEIDVSDTVSVTTELEETETLQTQYVYLPVVNLYDLPDTEGEPVALRYMEELQLGLPVIAREDGSWYRVFRDGQLKYLWSGDITESLTGTKNSLSSYTGNTVYQQQVIDLALEISEEWNTIYAHEQSDGIPNADGSCGFDCSGLTSYIFNRIMQPLVPTYRLYAALETQYATTGMYNAGYPGEFAATDVAPEDLQPGDILFFTSLADGTASTEIGHCGIYLGNNEFVHSTSSWEDAVCIMGLRGSYLENYVGARRYLPETVTPADTAASIVGPYYSYNLYSEQNSESAVVAVLAQYDPLTVLFTDNDTWAYVRTEDGHEGFFLTEHLGQYEYLEHLEVNVELNGDSRPYLSWNKIKNAQTYEICRSLQKNEGYNLLSATENTYYTNNTVPEGMTLYYQIRALDAGGNELDVSEPVSVYVPLTEPELLVTCYVAASSVKVYALPDSTSASITLRYMEEVQLGSLVTGSWYRVFLGEDLYYLYMTEGDGKLTDTKSSFSYAGNTGLQQEVLDLVTDIALNWNTIYATGQSNGVANADGTYGFNSPGLVKYVFNAVMQPKVPFYQLSQVLDTLYAATGLYNAGYPGEFAAHDVEQADMEPGDVLFFGSSQDISYCGIYLGSGEFVYSSGSWEDGVCIMPLKDFADSLVKIRRYLPDEVTPAELTGTVTGSYKTYKVYEEKDASSTVIATLALGDPVTLLYTDNGSWSYIRAADGTTGYLLLKYFS